MDFRQLLPEPGRVEVQDALDGVRPPASASPDRPYVLVNFIASADGRSTFAGRSGALGDDGDRAMFHGLRERADAVLAGTHTLAVERYGRMLGREERRQRRLDAGRSAEPIACIVTRTGELPTDIPLFAEPEARVLVFTAADVDLARAQASVEVVRLDLGELTLTTVMRRLRSDHQVEVLLCEGGPTLFGALLQESLTDELFLTVAPNLTGGGSSPAVTSGPELPELRQLRLAWVLERENALYLRYLVG
ncbi:MAG: dihydrofolate reductase family protein [Solirubrobacteraceae bacterium]